MITSIGLLIALIAILALTYDCHRLQNEIDLQEEYFCDELDAMETNYVKEIQALTKKLKKK